MGQHHRRADPFEQSHEVVARAFVHQHVVGDRRLLRGEELLEGRVTSLAGAGPLRVQLGLRPKIVLLRCGEPLFGAARQRRRHRTLRRRVVGGAATARLVHHVDRIALAEEPLVPAGAAVGGAEEIGPGLAAAMHHHDGTGLGRTGRNLELHEHLSGHRLVGARREQVTADEEVALPGDGQGRLGPGDRLLRCQRRGQSAGQQQGARKKGAAVRHRCSSQAVFPSLTRGRPHDQSARCPGRARDEPALAPADARRHSGAGTATRSKAWHNPSTSACSCRAPACRPGASPGPGASARPGWCRTCSSTSPARSSGPASTTCCWKTRSYVGESYAASREIYLHNGIAVPRQDPSVVATLMIAATSRIGIVPTFATFAYPPYLLARLMASLDQVSSGRAGWNMVTGSSDFAARNFGMDALAGARPALRHGRRVHGPGEPAVGVVGAGRHRRRPRERHAGGPHQGAPGRFPRPLLRLARAAELRPGAAGAAGDRAGRRLAARAAVRVQARRHHRRQHQGRRPRCASTATTCAPACAATAATPTGARCCSWWRRSWARRAEDALQLQGCGGRRRWPSRWTASWRSWARSPTSTSPSTTSTRRSPTSPPTATSRRWTTSSARRGNRTLREAIAAYSSDGGSVELVGSPDDVAAQMAEAMQAAGGDGFLFSLPNVSRRTIAEIEDGLVPALQRRGLDAARLRPRAVPRQPAGVLKRTRRSLHVIRPSSWSVRGPAHADAGLPRTRRRRERARLATARYSPKLSRMRP